MKDYVNSIMNRAIDEHIHSKRDRLILKLHYIDGRSPEWMANHRADYPDIDVEPRQICNIIKRSLEKLVDYI